MIKIRIYLHICMSEQRPESMYGGISALNMLNDIWKGFLLLSRSHNGCEGHSVPLTFICVCEGAGWHCRRGRCVARPCMNLHRMGSGSTARCWGQRKDKASACVYYNSDCEEEVSFSKLSELFHRFLACYLFSSIPLTHVRPHLQKAQCFYCWN